MQQKVKEVMEKHAEFVEEVTQVKGILANIRSQMRDADVLTNRIKKIETDLEVMRAEKLENETKEPLLNETPK